MSLLKRGWDLWDNFWFRFDHPLGLALVRIQLGLVLLVMYFHRQIYSLAQFTDAGMVPRSMALPLNPEYFRPPFGWFFWPDSMVVPVHALFVILCLLIVLGVGTRWIGWLTWILHIGFIQRNYAIVFGADMISCLFLFYLSFTLCDERLSVRSWWRKRKGMKIVKTDAVSSAFARLLQIQLMAIYAYTGMEKLKGNSWWDGSALWTVLANPQMVMFNMDWVRQFPIVIAGMTFSSMIFEIYWPAAVLIPKVRKPWLAWGAMFHSGIGLLMGLWTFSLTMLAPYWLFLKPAELTQIENYIKSRKA